MSAATLVILGCGFVGRVVAQRAIHAGRVVAATVRSNERASQLAREGIDVRVPVALAPELVRALASPGFDLLVAFPPDGVTDSVLASAPLGAARTVYLSSTGVYGNARGDVDEDTPVSPDSPRTTLRLEAESAWRASGAIALRAAAIYGTGRGLPRRIAEGTFQMAGDGRNTISQIHVDDLADLVFAAFERAARGSVYIAADDEPAPQIDAIEFVCERLGIPLPPSVAVDAVGESLRHDRRARNTRARRDLGWSPRFPSYREGFASVMP